MLGVSEWQLRRWIDEGLIPTVKFPRGKYPGEISRRVLVSVDDLTTFRDAHRVTSPEPNAALAEASKKGWALRPVRSKRKRGEEGVA